MLDGSHVTRLEDPERLAVVAGQELSTDYRASRAATRS
jgi:hypothetical protein